MKFLLAAFLALARPAAAPVRRPARPPAGEHGSATRFGERADISPDDQRVAFIAKSFGDAMVVDLRARRFVPHVQRAWRRVPPRDAPRRRRLHPDRSDRFRTSTSAARATTSCDRLAARPAPAHQVQREDDEGIAISKTSMKNRVLAGARAGAERAGRCLAAPHRRRDLANAHAALVNKKVVYKQRSRLHDRRGAGLLRSRHEDDVHVLRAEQRRVLMGIDLTTGAVTNCSRRRHVPMKSKGVFPKRTYHVRRGRSPGRRFADAMAPTTSTSRS